MIRFALALAAALAIAFWLRGLATLEASLCRVTGTSESVSEAAAEMHSRLFVVDMHADSLLWGRDLLDRGTRGHVDVPRLLDGGVALQAFTIVSKTPFGMNIESNSADSDMITVLAVAGGWPRKTWGSLKERALYQARLFDGYVERSGGKLVAIKTASDLAAYRKARVENSNVTAGFLGIEGAQVLEADLQNVDVMFDAGFRMMAPTHFFDTELGGSAHGLEKGGLTELGRAMIGRMEELGMLLDLAHASPALIDEALEIATKPIVVSHGGVRGTCDNTRNLSDRHVRAIAETGGVVSIGYWETAVCGTDARAIARAIEHAAKVGGIDHVALGSDFDGAVATPFDTTGLVHITDALMELGFDRAQIAKVMGGNAVRVLAEVLPD